MKGPEYGIQFEAILTDNGPEMSPRNTEGHPMDTMLNANFHSPFRPQTNGKIELLENILNEVEGTTFRWQNSELQQYLLY